MSWKDSASHWPATHKVGSGDPPVSPAVATTNGHHHTQLLIGVHSSAVGSCVYKGQTLFISYFLPELEVSCLRCLILGRLCLASVPSRSLSSFSGEDSGRLKQQTQRLEQVSVNFNEGPLRTIFWIRILIDLAFKAEAKAFDLKAADGFELSPRMQRKAAGFHSG